MDSLEGVIGNKQPSSVMLRTSHSSALSALASSSSFTAPDGLCWVLDVSGRGKGDKRIKGVLDPGIFN